MKKFCAHREKKFCDWMFDQEIHKNIVPRKHGAILCMADDFWCQQKFVIYALILSTKINVILVLTEFRLRIFTLLLLIFAASFSRKFPKSESDLIEMGAGFGTRLLFLLFYYNIYYIYICIPSRVLQISCSSCFRLWDHINSRFVALFCW